MKKLFEKETVIISGGIGAIGFATALEFAHHGANISLGGIDPETAASDYLRQLRELGISCLYKSIDVSDPKAVLAWVDETEVQIGTPTIILANAATVTVAAIHDLTSEQWSRELSVNLNGAFYLTQYATSRLVNRNLPGRVVFVGSWAGATPHRNMSAYSVSKAGMRMLCKCMALELAPHGILVNEIAPGYVAAGLSGRIWEENPALLEEAKRKVPTGKIMSAKDVAQQIVQLCHPQNEHMTGATLLMDDGLSLRSV